jgi:hypothetical protein
MVVAVLVVAIVVLVGGGGLIAVTGMTVGACTISAVGLGLFARYGPTRKSVLAKIRKGQSARRGQLRDLAALGAADTGTRQAWYRLVRRRVRRSLAIRLLATPLLIVVAIEETSKQTYDISHPLGFAVAGLFVVFYFVVTGWLVWGRLGDPVLVIGDFEFSQRTFAQEAAKTALIYGRTSTVIVFVRACFVLRADGTLQPSPEDLVGRQVLGARRAVVRRLIEGEHCVLLCSAGVPDVLFQAGAV